MFIIAAGQESSTLLMKRDKANQKDVTTGRRTPPSPIVCTINFTGYTIEGVDDEIFLYEVCEPDSDVSIAAFTDEHEFVEYLSCSNGSFMIRFTTGSYIYTGYLDKI